MRRRLTTLALAVTGLVVIAYTVPLAILVRDQADERARSEAEQLIQDVARDIIPSLSTAGGADSEILASSIRIPTGVTVLGNDGAALGSAEFDQRLAELAVSQARSVSRYSSDGSWQVSLPVISEDGWAVVSAVVAADDLRRGVWQAWAYLLVLGVGLIGAALFLSDRLGRTLRDPVAELADAAERIGMGDLDTPVQRPDITELSVVADALNRLAPQLRALLVSERESVADLSHRLRTPLAALRLQAEAVTDEDERTALLGLVDRMQASVDRLIIDARADATTQTGDLAAVARQRARFWSVLAEEEGRVFDWSIPDRAIPVDASTAELGDAIDVLVGNVFSHTDRGTAFQLTVDVEGENAEIAISDGGSGFPAEVNPLERGASGVGSTGLGLDIAASVADRSGGSISISSPLGEGARVVLTMPMAEREEG